MPTHEENAADATSLPTSAIPALERMASFIGDTHAARMDCLHNTTPELAHLAKALAVEKEEAAAGLIKFTADEKLGRIQKLAVEQRNEFDALDFIDEVWRQEEFHSRVLAWLLDPREDHDLGERFLTHFLLRAGVSCAVRSADWSTTEVTREWAHVVNGQQGYLDILIVNSKQQVLCSIENKVFSDEHSEQLTRYRKALERSFSTFTKCHVFLTPVGTHPVREAEKEYWISLAYSAVFDIVQLIVDDHGISVNEDVRAFLRQYAITLRRNIMPESSVSQLARRIYLEHREAIDIIIDNKPDFMAEVKKWIKDVIFQQEEWELDLIERDFIRFRSGDWDRYDATQTGIGWAPRSHALLLFEFTFRGKFPVFQLSLSQSGESESGLRQALFATVRQNPQLFRPLARSLSDKWIILHQATDILDETDFGVGWDDGTTRAKLEKWVTDFSVNEFPAMNEIIVNCLQECEAENKAS